jgi:hypothetical protein
MRARRSALVLLLVLTLARPLAAKPAPEADFRKLKDWAWFALGAASGFVAHELSHIVADLIFGKSISFVGVKLGPFPFFAIQPCCNLTHEQEYVIASAGFDMQSINSELILWMAPRLRSERRAFLKGILVLDIGLSLGYGITALAGIGPAQSDTNTMARGLGIPSWPIGIWLIVPAAMDLYRYLVPGSTWAPYVSLQGKLMMLGASFTF